jgi:hypothetical protein
MTTLSQFSTRYRLLPKNPVSDEAQRLRYSKQTHSYCSHYTEQIDREHPYPYVNCSCLDKNDSISTEYSLHLPLRLSEELLCTAGQKKQMQSSRNILSMKILIIREGLLA